MGQVVQKESLMTKRLVELTSQGQSIWYDNIDRIQLLSGLFQRLIDEDGITGATANPTIFEKSVRLAHAYDEQMYQLIREGKNTQEIYEALLLADIRTGADLLRPIYDATNGQDGFVSLEVSPDLADDTEGTLAEVRHFWKQVARPNLMVKIPATPAGIPAIRQALSEGININITLLFSVENYGEVVEAYMSALEERQAAGRAIEHIASVASFFVSRVDVLVDRLLEEKIKTSTDSIEQEKLKALEGKAAIANARLAYQEFLTLFHAPRFKALQGHGASVQRLLWASTSTKNPAYRDVVYAEELIGPQTIDTMPLQTIENFLDHGTVKRTLDTNIPQAKVDLANLERVGISYDQMTRQLQQEGVQTFASSFHKLLAGIDQKRKSV